MDKNVAKLDYAPKPPLNRRWLRRWIVLASIIGIGFPTWKWGPGIWHQSQLLYWQRQCMTYAPPADQVVYEEDPAKAAGLLAADPEYVPCAIWRGPAERSATQPYARAAAHVPRCWDQLSYCLGVTPSALHPMGSPGAIIFLHEMRSPNGTPYLVVLDYSGERDTFTPSFIEGYNWMFVALKPASIGRPAQWLPGSGYSIDVISGWFPKPPRVRIYAGQPDPNDPSHFTVRYEMWGQEDMLDGRIDDAGRVTLAPRQLPIFK